MTQSRIVFLLEMVPDERDERRFGFASLERAGFEIIVVITDAISGKLSPNEILKYEATTLRKLCTSLESLKELARGLDRRDAVIDMSGLWRQAIWSKRKLLSIIGRSEAYLTATALGGFPSLLAFKPSRPTITRVLHLAMHPKRWADLLTRIFVVIFVGSLRLRRFLNLTKIRSLDHVWVGTSISGLISPSLIGPSTSITLIHMLDYDVVLDVKGLQGHGAGVIFLDCMGPAHPDYARQGVSPAMTVEDYSALISRGLDKLENAFSAPVTIAAHPRARDDQARKLYAGRKIVHGKTAELIAQADVVACAEASTSIGIAASLKKPLVILPSNSFEQGVREHNELLIRDLNAMVIRLDCDPLVLEGLPAVDDEAYTDFLEKYMKKLGTPEQMFWQCVALQLHYRNS